MVSLSIQHQRQSQCLCGACDDGRVYLYSEVDAFRDEEVAASTAPTEDISAEVTRLARLLDERFQSFQAE
jgi:hypothetical protein